jgi:hypothetical protein
LKQDKEKNRVLQKEGGATPRMESMRSVANISTGAFPQNPGKFMIKMRFPLLQSTGKMETTVGKLPNLNTVLM